jgi:hypothetical protein
MEMDIKGLMGLIKEIIKCTNVPIKNHNLRKEYFGCQGFFLRK